MTRSDIIRKAIEFTTPIGYAIDCRVAYLVDSVEVYADSGCEVASAFIFQAIDEIIELKQRPKNVTNNEMVTDAMVETARRYPITRLINFRRGKARAWCHEDENPSLTLMTKSGRAWCPVCDKYFDAIGVLMWRDGMGFKEAVRRLQ